MAATNRGSIREPNDNYPTPDWLTKAMVNEVLVPRLARLCNGRPPRILEPAAGAGAVVQVLRQTFPEAVIDTGDITTGQDFLTYPYKLVYDVTSTNPPFSLALEFCQRALELRRTPESTVVMLARISFLESAARAAWWRQNSPQMFVTPRRPIFVKGQSDNAAYAWFAWPWDYQQHGNQIVFLKTEDRSRANWQSKRSAKPERGLTPAEINRAIHDLDKMLCRGNSQD
jgi:hypothetical protein